VKAMVLLDLLPRRGLLRHMASSVNLDPLARIRLLCHTLATSPPQHPTMPKSSQMRPIVLNTEAIGFQASISTLMLRTTHQILALPRRYARRVPLHTLLMR